jgi:hypothetical protein
MINKITVTNHLGESIELELMFPEKSGFIVREVEGLGPCKAVISTSPIGGNDGVFFNSARIATARNILIKFEFLLSPTAEDIRHKLYTYFPVKELTNIKIETDNRVCLTDGYIESNEVSIFSKDENSVISIICPDPYFYAIGTQIQWLYGTGPELEFPVSNESTTQKLINFGTQEETVIQGVIPYSGDISTGFLCTVTFTGIASGISITNANTGEHISIDSIYISNILHIIDAFKQGDILKISSLKGNKFITVTRNNIVTNILNAVNEDFAWFELQKGLNQFNFEAQDGIYMTKYMEIKIEYPLIYEGV